MMKSCLHVESFVLLQVRGPESSFLIHLCESSVLVKNELHSFLHKNRCILQFTSQKLMCLTICFTKELKKVFNFSPQNSMIEPNYPWGGGFSHKKFLVLNCFHNKAQEHVFALKHFLDSCCKY